MNAARHGPGHTYYEGPKGEFFLSAMTLTVDGKPVKFASASEGGAKDGGAAKFVIDGNPLTGMGAGQGRQAEAGCVRAGEASPWFQGNAGTRVREVLRIESGPLPGLGDDRAPGPKARRSARRSRGRTGDSGGQANAGAARGALNYWLDTAPEFKAERDEIEALRKQIPQSRDDAGDAGAARRAPRPTFRHHRGEFLQPKEKVEPGVPSWLPPLPGGAPRIASRSPDGSSRRRTR